MEKLFFVLVIFINILVYTRGADPSCPERGKYVACYYGSWSEFRPTGGRIIIEGLNAKLCTHLIFSFAGLNLDGEIDSLNPSSDFANANNDGAYNRFNRLKQNNPCLKTLLAIGGWGEGSEKYSLMAETEKRREEFVDRVERFLVLFGFDGLDIDWEYPTQRGGIAADKENFVLLIKLLRERLSLRNRLITVAIGTSNYLFDSYYPEGICEYSDLVFLMGYDLQYPDIVSTQAPIRREPNEPLSRDTLKATIDYYVEYGCEPEKLVLGIPAYGRTYTLKDATKSTLGSPVLGGGEAGPYTKERGFLGYNEICTKVNEPGWVKSTLNNNVAKVAVLGNQWIGYDDPETVATRTEYAMEQHLGGVMFWSIDTDDFYGICHGVAFPLLVSANKVLGNNMNF